MECKKRQHSINQRKCHNNWPNYPCYSRQDRACYNIAGTEQYFDPVSDTIDAITSGYLTFYDYIFQKLVERGVPPTEAHEIVIRERMRDHVPFGATSIVPDAARQYIPNAIERRIHPPAAVQYYAEHPLLNASENVGPGLRYSLARNLKDMGVSLYNNTVGRCKRKKQTRRRLGQPIELRRIPSEEHKRGDGKNKRKQKTAKRTKHAKHAKRTKHAKHAKRTKHATRTKHRKNIK